MHRSYAMTATRATLAAATLTLYASGLTLGQEASPLPTPGPTASATESAGPTAGSSTASVECRDRARLHIEDLTPIAEPWIEALWSFYASGDIAELETHATGRGLERLRDVDWASAGMSARQRTLSRQASRTATPRSGPANDLETSGCWCRSGIASSRGQRASAAADLREPGSRTRCGQRISTAVRCRRGVRVSAEQDLVVAHCVGRPWCFALSGLPGAKDVVGIE